MDIKRIIREEVSNFNWIGDVPPHLSETNRPNKGDMDWIESINTRYHKMNYDELEEIINKTFEGTRYRVELTTLLNPKPLTSRANTNLSIIDIKDTGTYIEFEKNEWEGQPAMSLDDIINTVERETKTMGRHVPVDIQEEYKELYELLNNAFPPGENLPWAIKEETDDMGWIKDIRPLDAINQRGKYKIWFGIIDEEEQNRILNILYDNGYEWSGFGNERPTISEVSSDENFDSLFLYNGDNRSYNNDNPYVTNNKSISWMGYNTQEDYDGAIESNVDKNKHHFYKKLMEYTELPKSIFNI